MPIIHKPTKREIIAERWYRGKLDYKLHAGQKLLRAKYRSVKTQLFVGKCARQFGKSFERVLSEIELGLIKPNARMKYGTAFQSDLVEFILPNFETILADCPKRIRPKYKSQGSKFVFENGSQIKLVGLDRNPNGLRGNAIDQIDLDEAGFISNLDYLYKSVIIPATTHRPDCRVSMISTPPSTPAHDFIDFCQKAELEGGYVKLTIYDNPMVDKKTIKRLMHESGGPESSTWKREYLCEDVLDSNLAICGEWKDEYVQEIPRDEYYPFYHKYNAMDLGTKHFTADILGYYDFIRAALIIEHDFVMSGPGLTTETLQKAIKEKEHEAWGDLKVYLRVSDNNNPLLLQDLSHLHKLFFNATDKGTLEEMVNAVRIMVGKGQILVHPRCTQLIGCLKYGVWDKRREKFAESKVYGHFDALAALVYLVRNLNKSTNPIPPDFQVDHNNSIYFKHIRESQTAKTFKQGLGIGGKS